MVLDGLPAGMDSLAWEFFIQRDIQLEHIHARLAEKSQIRLFGVLRDQLPNLFRRGPTGLSHPGSLNDRRIGTDMRIETRAGAGSGIGRDWRLRREHQWRLLVVESLDQLHVVKAATRIFEPFQRYRRFIGKLVFNGVVQDAKTDAIEVDDLAFLVVYFSRAADELSARRAEVRAAARGRIAP